MPHRCQFHQHFTLTFFVQKCFAQLYSYYSLVLGFFWRKDIGEKAARKMLMKLTIGKKKKKNEDN